MDRTDSPTQPPTETRSADLAGDGDVDELAEDSTDDGVGNPSEEARNNGKLNPSF
jgi:hypothetical protein